VTGLGPVLDDSGQPLDTVAVIGIAARGRHGVLAHERALGQPFVVDIVLHLDTRPAAQADDLARTVHYGVLADQVAAVVGGEPVQLVETLAQRVADVALSHRLVTAADVTVHKPQAPLAVPFADVAITIRRWRA
jgi:dihydroneopterin aldolase